MGVLGIRQFPEFYEAVTGFVPFRWQVRLAETVAGGNWPDVLDLPTASGKTSVLEIAVYTLALKAEMSPADRRAARRIFFVVDRRVVVDQAYDRAVRLAGILAGALEDGGGPSVLREVANRLRSLAGLQAPPLGHERLRGGIPRANAWTRSPVQPAIIACTVDQLGSRLLFRSYDGSNRAAPIHAGLAGNDALVFLDEAHCARPFLETMRAVQGYRSWGEQSPSSPFGFVSLSATPQLRVDDRGPSPTVFGLTEEERRDDPLRRRLGASKPAALTVARGANVPSGAGREEIAEARKTLAANMANRAVAFLKAGRWQRIAVMVNRVATALEVRDKIKELVSGPGDSQASDDPKTPVCDVVLMTGRMRPLDRDDLIAEWGPRLQAGGGRERLDWPVIVVSTQSLEVGADFDFDALVTEAASLDALRQRFGRVDRLGNSGEASAVVVVAAYQEKDSADDPIYGAALSATWSALVGRGDQTDEGWDPGLWPGLNAGEIAGRVDFGIEAMEPLLADTEVGELSAPVTRAPVMLPAHLDRWVQTAPTPDPDPDPAVFLHGGERTTPEVRLVWRLDLDGRADDARLIQALSLCPPSAIESLPVSLGWARRWMKGWRQVPAEESDVEGRGTTPAEPESVGGAQRRVVLWRGRDGSQVTNDPGDLRPGDFVVVAGSDLGPFEDLLAWSTDLAPVPDLGDRGHFLGRGHPVLRLHPRLIDQYFKGRIAEDLRQELADYVRSPMEDLSVREIRGLLESVLQDLGDVEEVGATWLKDLLRALLDDRFTMEVHPTGEQIGGVILRGRRRVAGEETVDQDEADRWTEGAGPVPLGSHLQGVEEYVVGFAEECGLPKPLVSDLAMAARLHDAGKADERFQAVLRGDGLRRPARPNDLLAKSPSFPTSRESYRRLTALAGLPNGFRHELVSARLTESHPRLLDAHDADLVLHLIVSHHGYCRPFAPVVVDDEPVEVSWQADGHALEVSSATDLERLDSGVPERFWSLVRRYGWWGLAYLEAILRTADHRRSEFEDRASVSRVAARETG